MTDRIVPVQPGKWVKVQPARRFRVHLQADQWDNNSFRYYTEVWAPDPEEARRLVWRMNPKAGIRRVEVVA